MASILVVDDQSDIRDLISIALQREGHSVHQAADGAEAMARFAEPEPPDLVLLDIGLPDESGLEVMRHIQQSTDIPVILVTGRSDEVDRILGLRLGADDYIVKPFSVGELTARVAAVLRRRSARGASTGGRLVAGPLTIDLRTRIVELRGDAVPMTHREFELLHHLASEPNVVFSREDLLRDIWHSKAEWQDPATVTEHVRRLRHKVEEDPARPQLIQTVRGSGYCFVPAAG